MTTTPPRRPTRLKITFTGHDDGPIARIASFADTTKLPLVITAMLNRYLHILHRNLPKLSDRELCAIIDALGQSWPGEPHQVHTLPRDVMPTIITDRLDTKWGIDAQQLRTRLERSTFTDRTTLTEFCLIYWMLTSEDQAPQVTLGRIRELLQPSTPTPDTRPRLLKISPVLFDQAEAGDHPDTGADDINIVPATVDPTLSDDDPAGLTDQQSGASPNENSEYSA